VKLHTWKSLALYMLEKAICIKPKDIAYLPPKSLARCSCKPTAQSIWMNGLDEPRIPCHPRGQKEASHVDSISNNGIVSKEQTPHEGMARAKES